MIRRLSLTACAVWLLSAAAATQPAPPSLLNPDDPAFAASAPGRFYVLLDTSKGAMLLDVQRALSPLGVDRFYNLVRHGYYDNSRFFRVRKGVFAQFGINGDPAVAQAWRTRTIPDEPRRASNIRGAVSYAFAQPNGRTTQVFINLQDNAAEFDKEPFVPFAHVVDGLSVADNLNAEYAEQAGGGIRAGKQDVLFQGGNAFLEREFPRLDYIRRASVTIEIP